MPERFRIMIDSQTIAIAFVTFDFKGTGFAALSAAQMITQWIYLNAKRC